LIDFNIISNLSLKKKDKNKISKWINNFIIYKNSELKMKERNFNIWNDFMKNIVSFYLKKIKLIKKLLCLSRIILIFL
jgi:hypothetical protein